MTGQLQLMGSGRQERTGWNEEEQEYLQRERFTKKKWDTEERQTYGQTQNPLERHRFHETRKQGAGPLDHFKLPEYFREIVRVLDPLTLPAKQKSHY